jgi:hypothetical protein
MDEAIKLLEEMIVWSDRLGLEEIYHIKEVIARLKGEL